MRAFRRQKKGKKGRIKSEEDEGAAKEVAGEQ